MSPRTATLTGLSAILMWSLLAVLTVATGTIPAFQLAAMTFAIGALVAFASFLFRPSAFAALKQPLVAWVVVGLVVHSIGMRRAGRPQVVATAGAAAA